jgi:hypothetical protein
MKRHTIKKYVWMLVGGVLLVASLQACSVTEVVASEDGNMATNVCTTCERTAFGYFWGLVEPPPIDPQCPGPKTMTKVRATNNFGHALITVLTLGIVMPQQVEWDCAPDTPPGPGRIGQ